MGAPKIVKIAAGYDFSLAVDTQGRVYAFGRNNVGQIGVGKVSSYLDDGGVEKLYATPTEVKLFTDYGVKIADVYTGVVVTGSGEKQSVAYATSDKGDLFLWGSGAASQLGGSVPVSLPSYIPEANIVDVATTNYGTSDTRALNERGTMVDWDRSNHVTYLINQNNGGMGDVPAGERAVELNSGYGSLFLTTTGAGTIHTYVKGSQAYGQLGNGSTSGTNVETLQYNSALDGAQWVGGGQSTMALYHTDFESSWNPCKSRLYRQEPGIQIRRAGNAWYSGKNRVRSEGYREWTGCDLPS